MYARWLGKPPLDPMKVTEPMMRKLVNAANSGDTKAISVSRAGASSLGQVVATIATALDSEAVMLVGPLVKNNVYRETLENILRNALRKKIDITVSNRRGIEAACMLAISELAATEAYLEPLLR